MRMARTALLTFLILPLLFSKSWAVDYCTADSNAIYCYKYTTDWGAGNITDVSAAGHNLAALADGKPDFLNSSPLSFGTSGSGDGYADFNGTDAEGTFSDTTKYFATQNMMIATWLNPDVAPGTTSNWAYHDDDFRATFTAAGSELQLTFIKSGGSTANVSMATGSNGFSTATWAHAAMISDFDSASAADTKMCKNGVCQNGDSGASFGITLKTDNVTFIGSRDDTGWYNGKLDESILYKNGTTTDVDAIYQYGITGLASSATTNYHYSGTHYGGTMM